MKIYVYKKLTKLDIARLCKRQSLDLQKTLEVVEPIVDNVKERGDEALFDYTKRLDGVNLKNIRVTKKEMNLALDSINIKLKSSLVIAKSNIEKFHKNQLQNESCVETMPGVNCFRENRAIEKVGLYIPGGTAPLFSTVLMLAVPANIAGCKDIILCTPPNKNGDINAAILVAAKLCGVDRIFKVGGAQAIAGMAYGTKTIPKVDKIFGPGNRYVMASKMLVSVGPEGTAIDMPAGPSEVLIIADGSAKPSFVAADLLSQAEHGPDSQSIFLCSDKIVIDIPGRKSKVPI